MDLGMWLVRKGGSVRIFFHCITDDPVEEDNLLASDENDLHASDEDDLHASEEDDLLVSDEDSQCASDEDDLPVSDEDDLRASDEDDLSASDEDDTPLSVLNPPACIPDDPVEEAGPHPKDAGLCRACVHRPHHRHEGSSARIGQRLPEVQAREHFK